MKSDPHLTRRSMLLLMAATFGSSMFVAPSFASDDDSGDDSDSGDSGADDTDNSGDSDNDTSDNSGSNNFGRSSSSDKRDQDDARDAVKKGKAISLSNALAIVKKRYPGRVIEVKLVNRGAGLDYRFKVIATGGLVKNVTMNATNGRIRGFFGF